MSCYNFFFGWQCQIVSHCVVKRARNNFLVALFVLDRSLSESVSF